MLVKSRGHSVCSLFARDRSAYRRHGRVYGAFSIAGKTTRFWARGHYNLFPFAPPQATPAASSVSEDSWYDCYVGLDTDVDDLMNESSEEEPPFLGGDSDDDFDDAEPSARSSSRHAAAPQRGGGPGQGRGRSGGPGRGRGRASGRGKGGVDLPSPPKLGVWKVVSSEEFPGLPEPQTTMQPKLAVGPLADHLNGRSRPMDIFNLFISNTDVKEWTKNSNFYAAAKGMGGEVYYPAWKPLSEGEVWSALGLILRQGIAPSPQFYYMFSRAPRNPWGGPDVQNAWPGGLKRWKEFKAAFHIACERKPAEGKLKKLEPWHSRLRDRVENAVIPCSVGSIDEATQGFQGRDADTAMHKDKAEGQGWQADCLAFENYIWTWFWRHEAAPKMVMGMAPLHQRCLWLLSRLKSKHPSFAGLKLWCDNLYLSHTFCVVAKEEGRPWPATYINGTVRKGGRGVPDGVKMVEEDEQKGSLRTLTAMSDDGVAVIACSDQKPVYFMGTTLQKLSKREVKGYDVWDHAALTNRHVGKEMLNVQESYNHGMNAVDAADQLSNNYRTDHRWSRARKPWWSQFHWLLRRAMVSAYTTHKLLCRRQSIKPMSHMVFHRTVMNSCFAMAGRLAEKRKKPSKAPESPEKRTRGDHSASLQRHADEEEKTSARAPRLTSAALAGLPRYDGLFHPVEDVPQGRGDKKRTCACCRLRARLETPAKTASGSTPQKRAHLRCVTCGVYFCGGSCFTAFHTAGGALDDDKSLSS